MKIARIIMIMAIIVIAFSGYGVYSVQDDPMIRQFFFVYLITGVLLFFASIGEMIHQSRKAKTAPASAAPAKTKVLLPKDETIE